MCITNKVNMRRCTTRGEYTICKQVKDNIHMDCNHRFQVSLIIVSLLLITTFFMQHFGQFSKVSTMMVESATAEVSNITIEFPPGFAIKNGTGQAIITGFQKCSEQTGFMSDLRGSVSIPPKRPIHF